MEIDVRRITGAAGFTYLTRMTPMATGSRKPTGPQGTRYWYMTPGIVAESDLSGNLKSEYVFFDGQRVARKDFPGNAVSYYFSDHLKTASVITDSAGNIKSESDYYPWGGELPFLSNDPNHYKHGGHERDGETGNDYYDARYYGSALGRFLTPDWSATPLPIPYADLTNPQSFNQYGYVGGNPASKADADGHGFLDRLKNLFTDGGFNENPEAQKERARRLHVRADDARKSLSGMKNFKINGHSPQWIAKNATDQQAIDAQ